MKRKTTEKKLRTAVSVIADIISSEASALKKENDRDIKQLKELTGAAKELAGVIKTLEREDDTDKTAVINVVFGEEEEKWAT